MGCGSSIILMNIIVLPKQILFQFIIRGILSSVPNAYTCARVELGVTKWRSIEETTISLDQSIWVAYGVLYTHERWLEFHLRQSLWAPHSKDVNRTFSPTTKVIVYEHLQLPHKCVGMCAHTLELRTDLHGFTLVLHVHTTISHDRNIWPRDMEDFYILLKRLYILSLSSLCPYKIFHDYFERA